MEEGGEGKPIGTSLARESNSYQLEFDRMEIRGGTRNRIDSIRTKTHLSELEAQEGKRNRPNSTGWSEQWHREKISRGA
jgi:hypothetical protein